MKKIKIFDLKYDKTFLNKFYKHSKIIFENGFLSNHIYVEKLEKIFQTKNKSKFAIAVNSGTSAIEIILRSLNIKGKKVLVSNNTFVSTGLAIKASGAIPVPIDIDSTYFGPSLTDIKNKIDINTKALVLVHIAGLVNKNLEEICNFCKKNHIHVIEDCAQAFGSKLNGKYVGNFGLAGAFSFQTTKVVTSGEGGIVTTNDKFFFEQLKKNRFYGFSSKNKLIHDTYGSNFKMSELNALVAILDIKRSQKRIKKRKKIADIYQKMLDKNKYTALTPFRNSETSYYKQVVISNIPREKIIKTLNKHNIPLTGGVYYYPLNRQENIKLISDKKYPHSSYFADFHFCPPCYPELDLKDIKKICDVLNNIS